MWIYWDLVQLGTYLRNGLIDTEELCAFPSLPCSPSLTSKSCLLLARSVQHGLWSSGAPLDCPLPSCTHEELEREVKGKTGA